MPPVTMTISRSYVAQAAHHLPFVPPGHKCGRVHGHTYEIEVAITGPIERTLGWVMDFAMLDAIVVDHVVRHLDHRDLNEIITNPTSEEIAWWIWRRLSTYGWPEGISLTRVSIAENAKSRVTLSADVPAHR